MGCLVVLFSACTALAVDDFALLAADRAAIERVYYHHRLGTKPAFEQTLPPAILEALVTLDLKKEAALKNVYGLEITPAQLAAEVQRINTTTQAPETLAEIKSALGHDPEKFAHVFAKPILVERELRQRFDNDDALHAAQRRTAEQVRARLLAKQPVENLKDVTWRFMPRPSEDQPVRSATPPPTKANAKSGAYTVEATAQLSQVVASPGHAASGKEKLYFEELDLELQKVFRVQLKMPGDVSAVIETPVGFLVFVVRERNAEMLKAASISIPKRSYDQWLAQQSKETP